MKLTPSQTVRKYLEKARQVRLLAFMDRNTSGDDTIIECLIALMLQAEDKRREK